MTLNSRSADVAIVGAGAAGLMAAIAAGRTAGSGKLRVVLIDGAKSLGAKILVAGGGRCNVTHHAVDEKQYAPAGARNSIRKVLGRFSVDHTISFFHDLGVDLKREDTGKLFPVTDRARTILDALLEAASDAGVEILHPWRATSIFREDDGFVIRQAADAGGGSQAAICARRVVLATGGKSLPKTGSDGGGYSLATSLGHALSERVFPALVPLVLERGHFLTSLSGISCHATLEVRSATNKRIASFSNPLLFTHFGLSGPAALDISRYFTDARLDDSGSRLIANLLPQETGESLDTRFRGLGRGTPLKWLRERLPERLATALMAHAGIMAETPGDQLTREARRSLVQTITELALPVAGDRGFLFAEVTAGGVPLSEVRLETMESRVCPGLFLCGEICDVDGRIGGFNFQWAWASGHVAGQAAAVLSNKNDGSDPKSASAGAG